MTIISSSKYHSQKGKLSTMQILILLYLAGENLILKKIPKLDQLIKNDIRERIRCQMIFKDYLFIDNV